MRANSLERRLQIAGLILLLGLVVEMLSLLGRGPVAFLVFAGFCATPIAVGILLYLHGLVARTQKAQQDADR